MHACSLCQQGARSPWGVVLSLKHVHRPLAQGCERLAPCRERRAVLRAGPCVKCALLLSSARAAVAATRSLLWAEALQQLARVGHVDVEPPLEVVEANLPDGLRPAALQHTQHTTRVRALSHLAHSKQRAQSWHTHSCARGMNALCCGCEGCCRNTAGAHRPCTGLQVNAHSTAPMRSPAASSAGCQASGWPVLAQGAGCGVRGVRRAPPTHLWRWELVLIGQVAIASIDQQRVELQALVQSIVCAVQGCNAGGGAAFRGVYMLGCPPSESAPPPPRKGVGMGYRGGWRSASAGRSAAQCGVGRAHLHACTCPRPAARPARRSVCVGGGAR